MDHDYRVILRQALVERCQRNPKYSLRAFAKQLKITPAWLSDILNGKKGLSRNTAKEISRNLGMSSKEQNYFCDLVESQSARSKAVRMAAKERLKSHEKGKDIQSISMDSFKVISDWHHFAILQLIKLPQFSSDLSWIAKSLGIQKIEAKEALGRLIRLGLVQKVNEGKLVASDYVSSPDQVPSDALKKFNEQLLKKASQAIYEQSIEERDFCSVMMPFPQKRLPEARKKIRLFVKELCDEFSVSDEIDHVYCFSTQLINYTASDDPTRP